MELVNKNRSKEIRESCLAGETVVYTGHETNITSRDYLISIKKGVHHSNGINKVADLWWVDTVYRDKLRIFCCCDADHSYTVDGLSAIFNPELFEMLRFERGDPSYFQEFAVMLSVMFEFGVFDKFSFIMLISDIEIDITNHIKDGSLLAFAKKYSNGVVINTDHLLVDNLNNP